MERKPRPVRPDRGFRFLTGDADPQTYGGKWVRRVGETRYHVIELLNWGDATGEPGPDGARYNLDLSEIDTSDHEQASSALRSCGWMLSALGVIVDKHSGDVVADGGMVALCIVEAMHSYGAKAPLASEDGNNWRELFRAMVRESKALDDSEAHAVAMARPVNRIGSTAAEFARGDVQSAILRGLEAGDPTADLMARMGMLKR